MSGLWILAAAMATEGAGSNNAVYLLATAIVALVTGGSGVALVRRRNGNSDQKDSGTCHVHDQLVKLLDERKDTQDAKIDELKKDHEEFAKRTDDNFKELFRLLRKQ